jgi:transposase
MHDRDLYAQVLGIRDPWKVVKVELDTAKQEVSVFVEAASNATHICLACGNACPGYDTRQRRWRHLDTCQFKTILVAEVPRVECPEHGVQQVPVPWAEPNSRFTGLFEAMVIGWLMEASTLAVTRMMKLTWKEVDGIMFRAVVRGLSRRELEAPAQLGVDETSYQKRHEYVTVVIDQDGNKVLYVSDDRSAESLASFYRQLSPAQKKQILVVAMDMHEPYAKATREALPDGDDKIAYDRFHVAKHLGDAVDKVRREEHRALMERNDQSLLKTKHLWLQNEGNITDESLKAMFEVLKGMNLKTGRAWAIKECARDLWDYVRRGSAEKAWKKWIAWARRSQLEPIKRVAAMIRDHLKGILTAIEHHVTNAGSESINAKIQKIKARACGFRSRERFKNAIYFHLGGLALYPASAGITHTNS